MEVHIGLKFSLIFLITLKEGINRNQDVDLEDFQENFANFKVDKIDCHKTNEQTDFKLQLHW